jgi:hypothetical protein
VRFTQIVLRIIADTSRPRELSGIAGKLREQLVLWQLRKRLPVFANYVNGVAINWALQHDFCCLGKRANDVPIELINTYVQRGRIKREYPSQPIDFEMNKWIGAMKFGIVVKHRVESPLTSR